MRDELNQKFLEINYFRGWGFVWRLRMVEWMG